MGIEVIECNLDRYDAINADEACFTSTAFTLMPCVKVHGTQLADGQIGPITKKIINAWNELAGLDFIAQTNEYLQEMGADGYSGTTTYSFRGKK